MHMSHTYAERKQISQAKDRTRAADRSAAGRSVEALASGAAKPAASDLGERIDLSSAMRAKMEASFGADLSGVRLYESRRVAEAGADAVTQGSRIVFAPGKADFGSRGGQELLGHELSHVVSQARGEVTGKGFLQSPALETRADREGAMAAAGEQVYSGPVTAPLSAASAAPASGPMQAKKNKDAKREEDDDSDGLQEYDRTGAAEPLFPMNEDKTWRQAHSEWKKKRDKKNRLKQKTGLSNKKKDIQARMDADMKEMHEFDDDFADIPRMAWSDEEDRERELRAFRKRKE